MGSGKIYSVTSNGYLIVSSAISGKVENFIKSAAYVDLPNMYPETKTDIPHTLLQGMFRCPEHSVPR